MFLLERVWVSFQTRIPLYIDLYPIHLNGQWNLRIKDTLGPAISSSFERLSFSQRSTAMGEGSKTVSFVGRLSHSQKVFIGASTLVQF